MKKWGVLFLLVSQFAFGQTAVDTVTFMQYNLLNYRNSTSYCTNSNNNATSKDGYMNTIVGYVLPDIIACNEIAGDGGTAANRLLTNALNKDGRSYYKQCTYSANSNLCNMLYYNKNKFSLANQDKIRKAANNTTLVRQIDVYTLYYNYDSDLVNGDTTFLVVYVTHLKAGSTSADKVERAEMTEAVMSYHANNYEDVNYIIAGDFNIQTSSEACYQNLIANSNSYIQFYDPKNKAASWNNNSLYSDLHTQSTRTSSSGGCFSTGGMDDRFDFVLCGKEILDNTRGMEYIDGSYKAVGNDALHFNKSLISPANTSVPANVLSALYNMSDHLPVELKLGITKSTAGAKKLEYERNLVVGNPIQNVLSWKLDNGVAESLEIRNIQGKLIYSSVNQYIQGWNEIDASNWLPGTYVFNISLSDETIVRKKVVKL
ncbi:MAG: T9SS type A sorting domain-containing protein [Bacteroidia bacterium]|nr:T9SS type A sorting domain-containing protein [Bacteroidia bacterium]NNJ55257.1 T9SS type A sorting domain-containing protein [Bacteroidia bacterium]